MLCRLFLFLFPSSLWQQHIKRKKGRVIVSILFYGGAGWKKCDLISPWLNRDPMTETERNLDLRSTPLYQAWVLCTLNKASSEKHIYSSFCNNGESDLCPDTALLPGVLHLTSAGAKKRWQSLWLLYKICSLDFCKHLVQYYKCYS